MRNTILYEEIKARVEIAATRLVPEPPIGGRYKQWKYYEAELEGIDPWDVAGGEVDTWAWGDCFNGAMQIVELMNDTELSEAETAWHEQTIVSSLDENFGLLEFLRQLVSIFFTIKLEKEIEYLSHKYLKLTKNKLKQLKTN